MAKKPEALSTVSRIEENNIGCSVTGSPLCKGIKHIIFTATMSCDHSFIECCCYLFIAQFNRSVVFYETQAYPGKDLIGSTG